MTTYAYEEERRKEREAMFRNLPDKSPEQRKIEQEIRETSAKLGRLREKLTELVRGK